MLTPVERTGFVGLETTHGSVTHREEDETPQVTADGSEVFTLDRDLEIVVRSRDLAEEQVDRPAADDAPVDIDAVEHVGELARRPGLPRLDIRCVPIRGRPTRHFPHGRLLDGFADLGQGVGHRGGEIVDVGDELAARDEAEVDVVEVRHHGQVQAAVVEDRARAGAARRGGRRRGRAGTPGPGTFDTIRLIAGRMRSPMRSRP